MSIGRLNLSIPVLGLLLLITLNCPLYSIAESPNCLAVYKQGGAPAVFRSPKCPRWTRPSPTADLRHLSGCHVALRLGRRRYQEDRAVCAIDLKIPFLGRTGIKEIDVGIVAVFDGHNGAEASDMASKLLLDYFFLHIYFLLDVTYSMVLRKPVEILPSSLEPNVNFIGLNLDKEETWEKFDPERLMWMSPVIFDGPFHLEILKESLLRTIHDIDATFSKEALKEGLGSGSTATVVLLADGQLLAANVGDSKSILCSENIHISERKASNGSRIKRRRRYNDDLSSTGQYGNFQLSKYDGPTFFVKELTKDHHPDRKDERNRVEAAGGYVLEWAGVPRVNGELAISRAIGDLPFKRYGVISMPELTEWQAIYNDSYLVVASDGIFEKMATEDVCHLLWDEKVKSHFGYSIAQSLADSIVDAAFRKGTMDNMAAIVVPLGSAGMSEIFVEDENNREGKSDMSFYGLQKALDSEAAVKNATSTSLIPIEYYYGIISKFNHLLVETKYKSFGCFYLSENLNEDVDYVFRAPVDYEQGEAHDWHHSFQESVDSYHGGGPLDLYKDQKLCWHFGIHEGDKGQCTSPELFAKFLGLLDSVPYSDTTINSSESSGHLPDFRYVLKRRFDRGSYGEVWLAFHWNCSEVYDAFNPTDRNFTRFASDLHLNIHGSNMNIRTGSSDKNLFNDLGDDNLFILKRIMVERGNSAYLSGLREKYFGENFLNASTVQGLTSARLPTVFSMEEQLDSSDLLLGNSSNMDGIDSIRTFSRNLRTRVNYEEGLKHIARFVESFESEAKEIWLVFQNEGQSLSKLIYTAEETKIVTGDESKVKNVQVLRPSAWWYWLRTTERGGKEMQNLIRQLLLALKSCHDRSITHRDIKPENMIVCFENVNSGRCSREIPSDANSYHLRMRIIDFGSAIDEFTLKNLYGPGPTRSEQTFEYTPPEALLNVSWFQEPKSETLKYDMWSVGVVMLELIIGSPHIFQISDRTRALLDHHLEGWSEHTKELAYKLRSYMEMCILIPGVLPRQQQKKGPGNHGGGWLASWKCSEESFSHQVKSRDPLKLGFPNVWALRLARQLLVWHPEDRLSVDDALNHPYFQQHS